MKRFSLNNREYYCRGRFVKICGLYNAWYEDVEDPETLVASLKNAKENVHIFTFFQRVPHIAPKFGYHVEPYSVAVIKLSTYEEWWKNAVSQKVRQAVNKSQKKGVEVRVTNFDDDFISGIGEIYNETPVRQGRPFPHYQDSFEKVKSENGTFLDKSIFLGAYHENELVGFAKIVFENEFADVLQFLSKIAHRDKIINNALLAKIIEVCAERGVGYLAYGDLGAGGLDDFKRNNGFSRMDLPRYYIPLNWVGKLAMGLNLHRGLSAILPERLAIILKEIRRKCYGIIANKLGQTKHE